MFLQNYKKFPNARFTKALLWEYDQVNIDFEAMKSIIIARVVQRGDLMDWYFILNKYGVDEVRRVIRDIPYLNNKDEVFVSKEFDIPREELRCYKRKQSRPQHWKY